MSSDSKPDCFGEPGIQIQVPVPTNMNSNSNLVQDESKATTQDGSLYLQAASAAHKSVETPRQRSIHCIVKPHISQTTFQRPDEKIMKHQYKNQLQRQIEEQRRRKEERIHLEKQEEDKLQQKIDDDRRKMIVEQQEEVERKKIRDEAIKQREELTLKQIEASRLQAEEDRRKRIDEKRHSTTMAEVGAGTDADLEKSASDWMNHSTYSNPHDEQVIKTKVIDIEQLMQKESSKKPAESDGLDDDFYDEVSARQYYHNDAPSMAGIPSSAFEVPESLLSTVSTPKGNRDTQAFLKELKEILLAEEQRMRILISKRSIGTDSSGTEEDAENEVLDDEENYCSECSCSSNHSHSSGSDN